MALARAVATGLAEATDCFGGAGARFTVAALDGPIVGVAGAVEGGTLGSGEEGLAAVPELEIGL